MAVRRLEVLTNSELVTWRDCRARWGFKYPERLRTLVDTWPQTIGSILHAGLEEGLQTAWSIEDTPAARVQTASALAGAHLTSLLFDYEKQLNEMAGDMELEHVEHLLEETRGAHELGRWMVEHYFQLTESQFEHMVPLALEQQFHVPIPDSLGRPRHLYLDGKIDGVFLDLQQGVVVVRDYKTTTDNPDSFEARLQIDPQMTGYLHAVRDLLRRGLLKRVDGGLLPEDAHERVAQVQYEVLRRKMPTEPKANKVTRKDVCSGEAGGCAPRKHAEDCTERLNALQERELREDRGAGLVSVDKSIDTLAALYDDALVTQEARGLPRTSDQEERLKALQAKGDTFFRRFEYWRDPAETERWRKELWVENRQMQAARRDPSLRTRNPGYCTGFAARRCEYQAVCREDVPETRRQYRVADTEHEELRA